MTKPPLHTFYVPVMGLGFTIDTPLKVGRYGISSVISIVEDNLIEQMRKIHAEKEKEDFTPINKAEPDFRAKRITTYLNLLNKLLKKQVNRLKASAFKSGSELAKYFELLPQSSILKQVYEEMLSATGKRKEDLIDHLINRVTPGDIDVNIMTKVDKTNYDKAGNALPAEYSDALSALRGYAQSDLSSSVVFSAGMNPRLYSYCTNFDDFFPDEHGRIKKRIILKVSDYRSALIQGKFLAKKGLWVSEYRVESGLNCGGHAFGSKGTLLGPILQEFKEKRTDLHDEIYSICNEALKTSGRQPFSGQPSFKITAQGGVGSSAEHNFLIDHYDLDGVGWGSPFLLVPEASTVDKVTLRKLATAKKSDYYLGNASPLGVPFNNFRPSSSEAQRKERIESNRPGSPCYKKFLVTSTEFTDKPICTASRQYQHLKIKALDQQDLSTEQYKVEYGKITEKDCLCEGLGTSALLGHGRKHLKNLNAVTICPGPNLAYFSGVFSLREMVGHIYGKHNVLNARNRPHMFVNELLLNIDYLKKELKKHLDKSGEQSKKQFEKLKANLTEGIKYYRELFTSGQAEPGKMIGRMAADLMMAEMELKKVEV